MTNNPALTEWRRRRHRILVEATVGPTCRFLHRKPTETLGMYDGAAVLAHRPTNTFDLSEEGPRRKETLAEASPIGVNDFVLVECFPTFVSTYGDRTDHFVLMSAVPDSSPPRQILKMDIVRRLASVVLVIAMVTVVTFKWLPLLEAAIFVTLGLVFLRCITLREAWKAIDGRLITTIAAAFGVSAALKASGTAELLANGLVQLSKPGGELGLMIAIYLGTMLLSAAISNNATVLLMLPIVEKATQDTHVFSKFRAFVMVIIYAASASFITPIGYQTNLMVWKPGGYTFADFPRLGVGLQFLFILFGVGGPYLFYR